MAARCGCAGSSVRARWSWLHCRATRRCSALVWRARPRLAHSRSSADNLGEDPPHLNLSILDARFKRREIRLIGGPRQQTHQVGARCRGTKSLAETQSQNLAEILIET